MNSIQKSLICLLTALLLSACGGPTGGSNPGGGSQDFTVAGPSTPPNVNAGSTVAVPVTVARSGGFTGVVNVDLTSPPAGVLATQVSIAPESTTANVNIFVPSSLPTGPLALTLNATAIGFSAKTAALTLSVTGGTGGGTGDTTAPTVTLESIANVSTESTITLRATASDNVGVSKVEFYDGTTKLGEDTSSPYSLDVPIVAENNGLKSFTAKAFDAAGNVTTSSAQTATVSIPFISQTIASSASDQGSAIVRDSSGNVYVVGDTMGNLAVPTLGDNRNFFVRKFGPSGAVVSTWGTNEPGNQIVNGHTAGVDASGNLYVAGITDASMGGLLFTGRLAVFLRKYSPNGDSLLWTRLFNAPTAVGSTSTVNNVTGLALDPSGNIFLTGFSIDVYTDAGIDVDGAYLTKYSPEGTALWTQQFRNDNNTGSNYGGVMTDASGNVYITGSTIRNLDSGNFGGIDTFVRKYDGGGTLIWTSQVGSSGNDFATGISVGITNDFVYVSGYTTGNLVGTNSGGNDAVIYRCTKDDGQCVAWQQFGTSTQDYLHDIASDATGRITVVGNTDFPRTSSSSYGLIRQFEANGTVRWTRQFGTGNPAARESLRAVTVDASGRSYIAGYTYTVNTSGSASAPVDALLRSLSPFGALR
jgi:hypothetical protein